MNTLDCLILLLIGISVFKGSRQGLVSTIGQLASFLFAYSVAILTYPFLAEIFKFLFLGNVTLTQICIFILVFLVIVEGAGFGLDTLDLPAKIPFLEKTNSWGGAFLGLITGLINLGTLFYFLSHLPFEGWLKNSLATSLIAPKLTEWSAILIEILPWGP